MVCIRVFVHVYVIYHFQNAHFTIVILLFWLHDNYYNIILYFNVSCDTMDYWFNIHMILLLVYMDNETAPA